MMGNLPFDVVDGRGGGRMRIKRVGDELDYTMVPVLYIFFSPTNWKRKSDSVRSFRSAEEDFVLLLGSRRWRRRKKMQDEEGWMSIEFSHRMSERVGAFLCVVLCLIIPPCNRPTLPTSCVRFQKHTLSIARLLDIVCVLEQRRSRSPNDRNPPKA